LKTAMMSRRGGRENNEDSIGKFWTGDTACFAVADGLGGNSGGEKASKAAVDAVLRDFNSRTELSEEAVRDHLSAAQRDVIEAKGDGDMAAAIVALVTDGRNAVWGHCGNCRLYRLENGMIQEVTEDHTVSFLSFMADKIMYKDIRHDPGRNKLVCALGNDKTFNPIICGPRELPLHSAFLLCTDGFWEYVTEPDMERTIKKADSPKKWLELMLNIYKRNAPQNADNYSAIAVFI